MVPTFPALISETGSAEVLHLCLFTILSKGILQMSSRLAVGWLWVHGKAHHADGPEPVPWVLAPLVAEEEAWGEMTHCCWLQREEPPKRNAGALSWEGSAVNSGSRAGLQSHNRRNLTVLITWMSLEVAFPSEPPDKASAWQPDIPLWWAEQTHPLDSQPAHCVLRDGYDVKPPSLW